MKSTETSRSLQGSQNKVTSGRKRNEPPQSAARRQRPGRGGDDAGGRYQPDSESGASSAALRIGTWPATP